MMLKVHAPGNFYITHNTTACGRLYYPNDRIRVSGETTDEEVISCRVCINRMSWDSSVGRRKPKLKLVKGGLYETG